jgi:hypothetical protein
MARLRQLITFRLSFALALGGFLSVAATAQTGDEYSVKAAFLYNFSKFVEWPPQAFKSPTDPLTICILGKNPFGDLVSQAVTGKVVQGRSFSVLQVTDVPQAGACHILFVSASENKRLPAILAETKSSCTLTVGETDDFTAQGGVISFKIEAGNVRFCINAGAAAKQQLHISSKLLSLAEVVRK